MLHTHDYIVHVAEWTVIEFSNQKTCSNSFHIICFLKLSKMWDFWQWEFFRLTFDLDLYEFERKNFTHLIPGIKK